MEMNESQMQLQRRAQCVDGDYEQEEECSNVCVKGDGVWSNAFKDEQRRKPNPSSNLHPSVMALEGYNAKETLSLLCV